MPTPLENALTEMAKAIDTEIGNAEELLSELKRTKAQIKQAQLSIKPGNIVLDTSDPDTTVEVTRKTSYQDLWYPCGGGVYAR